MPSCDERMAARDLLAITTISIDMMASTESSSSSVLRRESSPLTNVIVAGALESP